MAGCQRLLASFWKHIGEDNDDYEVGYVARAEGQWISCVVFFSSLLLPNHLTEQERKFFAKEYMKEQTRKQEREHKTKQASSSIRWAFFL